MTASNHALIMSELGHIKDTQNRQEDILSELTSVLSTVAVQQEQITNIRGRVKVVESDSKTMLPNKSSIVRLWWAFGLLAATFSGTIITLVSKLP